MEIENMNITLEKRNIIWLNSVFSIFPVSAHIQCDPALLPEPNHVMLNHLYALSIKVRSQVD